MQYFTKKERDEAAQQDKSSITNYNELLPHYQLGKALLDKQLPSLVDYLDPRV